MRNPFNVLFCLLFEHDYRGNRCQTCGKEG